MLISMVGAYSSVLTSRCQLIVGIVCPHLGVKSCQSVDQLYRPTYLPTSSVYENFVPSRVCKFDHEERFRNGEHGRLVESE